MCFLDRCGMDEEYDAYCRLCRLEFMSDDGLHLHMVSSACCGGDGYTYHLTPVSLTLDNQTQAKQQWL